MFFRIFQHILPNARAWRLTADKNLRRFFEGLSGIGADVKEFADLVYLDLFPDTTRALPEWEQQWGLPDTGLTEQERRDRLDATWKAEGGQSPRYIEDTLRAAGFDVHIHEWWIPIGGRPGGGSIDNDVTPVPRNPNQYLDDGSGGFPALMFDGGADSQDNDAESQDGSTSAFTGYPLVNKILQAVSVSFGDGSPEYQDGGLSAQDNAGLLSYSRKQYLLPTDPLKYPFFLYIGGQTFPDNALVSQSRREEFENLCLKICPTEQWLGILVTYS